MNLEKDNPWLRRFSVVVAFSTLLLVIAGGLVTSNDAGLSVPDWPLAYGRLIPNVIEGGIVFEYGHRVVAATVSILVFALAVWLQKADERRWMRRLGWLAFGAILAQAALGGIVVIFMTPKAAKIPHACLAELVFGLTTAIMAGQLSRTRTLMKGAAANPVLWALGAVYVQTILGAAVRHKLFSVIPHIFGAMAATAFVLYAAIFILLEPKKERMRRNWAAAMLALTLMQVFLGIGAYMSRLATVDAPQPMAVMVWFTVAHLALGALTFGSVVANMVVAYRPVTAPARERLAAA